MDYVDFNLTNLNDIRSFACNSVVIYSSYHTCLMIKQYKYNSSFKNAGRILKWNIEEFGNIGVSLVFSDYKDPIYDSFEFQVLDSGKFSITKEQAKEFYTHHFKSKWRNPLLFGGQEVLTVPINLCTKLWQLQLE